MGILYCNIFKITKMGNTCTDNCCDRKGINSG